MYQLKEHKEEGVHFVTVYNKVNGSSFCCCKDYGASLIALRFRNRDQEIDILQEWNLEKPRDVCLQKFVGSQLFPFPNRLSNGSYKHHGVEYQFDLNDKPNALHGFVFNRAFEIESFDHETGNLVLSYFYDGLDQAYPFACKLTVRFSLNESSLNTSVIVSNESDKTIPVGHGWHPYFNLPLGLYNTKLVFPKTKMIVIDEHMIPTGEYAIADQFSSPHLIKDYKFDNCFVLNNANDEIGYAINESDFVVMQFENYNYFQIYTPQERDCIAIEPMSCNIDGFNNRDGLQLLDPRQKIKFSFRIRLENDYAS